MHNTDLPNSSSIFFCIPNKANREDTNVHLKTECSTFSGTTNYYASTSRLGNEALELLSHYFRTAILLCQHLSQRPSTATLTTNKTAA